MSAVLDPTYLFQKNKWIGPFHRFATSTSSRIEGYNAIWPDNGTDERAATAPKVHIRTRMRILDASVSSYGVLKFPAPMELILEAAPQTAPEVEPTAQPNGHALADVEWIQDALALSMAELAMLAGVSRMTAYNWFYGSIPQAKTSEKFASIRLALDSFDPQELRFLRRVWGSSQFEGRSLLGILKAISSPTCVEVSLARTAVNALQTTLQALIARSRETRVSRDLGMAHTEDLIRGV